MDDIQFDNKAEIIKKRNKKKECVIIAESDYIDINSLNTACIYLQNSECKLILTNIDEYDMINGHKYLGVGSYYDCLKSSLNNNEVLSIGKPERFGFEEIKKRVGSGRTLMIGDRMNTDIQFGVNNNISTLLVMSGVTQQYDSDVHPTPTYILPRLGSIYSLLS